MYLNMLFGVIGKIVIPACVSSICTSPFTNIMDTSVIKMASSTATIHESLVSSIKDFEINNSFVMGFSTLFISLVGCNFFKDEVYRLTSGVLIGTTMSIYKDNLMLTHEHKNLSIPLRSNVCFGVRDTISLMATMRKPSNLIEHVFIISLSQIPCTFLNCIGMEFAHKRRPKIMEMTSSLRKAYMVRAFRSTIGIGSASNINRYLFKML